jgi:hypothetical protein
MDCIHTAGRQDGFGLSGVAATRARDFARSGAKLARFYGDQTQMTPI